jgi:hypothetical protein
MSALTGARSFLAKCRGLFAEPATYVALALIAVEATYFLPDTSPWRKYGAWFWGLITLVALALPWIFAFSPFFNRAFWRLRHRGWYLLAFFLPPALLVVGLNGIVFTRFNVESSQEVGGALAALRHDPSYGIFGLGYLTVYPMRQYLVTCWPTLVFGPSVVALRLGFGLFYLGGYFSFLAGTFRYLEQKKAPEAPLLAAYAGLTVALGTFPLLWARMFEQTILPLSGTLLLLGGVLFFLTRPSLLTNLWVMWTVGFLPYCYTPALATAALGSVLLPILIFRYHLHRLLPAFVYGLCTAWVALSITVSCNLAKCEFYVGDPVGNWNFFTWSDWAWRFVYGFSALAGSDQSLIPAPLVLGILAALYLGWRHRDHRFLLLCGWAVGTVGAAIALKGWCWSPPQFDLHRAMVILPLVSLGVVLVLERYAGDAFRSEVTRRIITFVLVGSLLFMVLKGAPVPFLERSPDVLGENLDDLEEALITLDALNSARHPLTRIYLAPPLDVNLEWGLVYLRPEATVIRGEPPPDEKSPGSYVLSFRSTNFADHIWTRDIPSYQRRPYLQIRPLDLVAPAR